MPRTMLAQIAEDLANEKLTDPQQCLITMEYLKRLRARYYDYQDVIVQKWDRDNLSIYDAFAFANLHAQICYGRIVAAWVNVGHIPTSNKKAGLLNEVLGNLTYPFSAEFWGGTQDEDGILEIAEPIDLDIIRADTGERIIKSFSGSFPLEVGYMDAAKAMHYLNEPTEGRLARWPYRYDKICLLARVAPPNWSL